MCNKAPGAIIMDHDPTIHNATKKFFLVHIKDFVTGILDYMKMNIYIPYGHPI